MTTTLQPETRSSSRRALLAGTLGGLAALAATVIGRPSPTRANDPNDVLLGGANAASATTHITFDNAADTFAGHNNGGGDAVNGYASSGNGVFGTSASGDGVSGSSGSGIGVVGYSGASDQPSIRGRSDGNSTGVQGFSGSVIPAAKAKTGVYGYANQDNFSRGVIGESPAGIGVYGLTTTGYAGYFGGKVYTTQFYELSEIGTPAAPLANRARLFVKDNGAGKTQLCVRFQTGPIKILAIES